MAAYIAKTWQDADGITYATTTETNDSASVAYFIFDAATEADALAALRADAPTTYALGAKTISLSALSITGRVADTIWSGNAQYSGATNTALGGSFAFKSAVQTGGTISLVLDLVTPAAVQLGIPSLGAKCL